MMSFFDFLFYNFALFFIKLQHHKGSTLNKTTFLEKSRFDAFRSKEVQNELQIKELCEK